MTTAFAISDDKVGIMPAYGSRGCLCLGRHNPVVMYNNTFGAFLYEGLEITLWLFVVYLPRLELPVVQRLLCHSHGFNDLIQITLVFGHRRSYGHSVHSTIHSHSYGAGSNIHKSSINVSRAVICQCLKMEFAALKVGK